MPSEPFDIEPPYDAAAPDLEPDRFLDRELSWLHFNERVLELAEDPDLPLLERVRFLAIFANNLDEFFMVRVAGLKRRIAAGVAVPAASGLLPREVLDKIWSSTSRLMERHATPLPRRHHSRTGRRRTSSWCGGRTSTRDEQKECKKLFKERVFPVLTPLAVDPAHPFPYISGLSLNLAVLVRNPKTGKEHFARVKVPPIFARFVPVGNQRFVPLEDVIGEHLKRLFPGMEVLGAHTFRVTRNEDLEVEEDDAENLLAALEKELLRRRFGPPVRLEVEESIDQHILDLLVSELGIAQDEVMRLPGPLDLRGLNDIADLDRAELKYANFVPSTHTHLAEVESASPVERVQGAASSRRTPAPPVRLVLHLGAALHRAGRGRSAGAGHQADAVPHLGRLPDHRGTHRRRRGGQAGAGARGDQGSLRRAGEHQVGAQAGACRLPRRLRPGRAQDALQARARGA